MMKRVKDEMREWSWKVGNTEMFEEVNLWFLSLAEHPGEHINQRVPASSE